jgi:hypothetical protein
VIRRAGGLKSIRQAFVDFTQIVHACIPVRDLHGKALDVFG